MSFISRTCLVPTIIVFILAFPHYMLNLLLREGRRCGVLQRRILGVHCSLDDLFVVFGVFLFGRESHLFFCKTIIHVINILFVMCTLYFTYTIRMCCTICLWCLESSTIIFGRESHLFFCKIIIHVINILFVMCILYFTYTIHMYSNLFLNTHTMNIWFYP
jgi:hypothetical protein